MMINRSIRRVCSVILTTALFLTPNSLSATQDQVAAPGQVAAQRMEKIATALTQPVDAQYQDAPLTDVAANLEQGFGIEIEFDTLALENAGISAEAVTVTRNIAGIRLASLLNLILRDLDMTYLVENDVVMITTLEQAKTEIAVSTYPVKDLASDEGALESLKEQILELFTPDAPNRMLRIAVRPSDNLLAIRTDILTHREIGQFLAELRGKIPTTEMRGERVSGESSPAPAEQLALPPAPHIDDDPTS